jgi:hypothetical protein
MSITLRDSEVILFNTPARHIKRISAKGELCLTNERLVFKSGFILGGKAYEEFYSINDIVSVRQKKTLGISQFGIIVSLQGNRTEQFAVDKPDEWMNKILEVTKHTSRQEVAVVNPVLEKDTPETVRIIQDENYSESTEIVGFEDFPLDNSKGGDVLIIESEVSKTVTNEISVGTEQDFGALLGADLFTFIKTEISTRISRQVGQKAGEITTHRKTVRFSVNPGHKVTYTVLWKRKVRKGQYIVMGANEKAVSIPYQIHYDLSLEVKSS